MKTQAQISKVACQDALSGVGLGLKPLHYQDIVDTRPPIDWFEIHPENYMGDGGPPHRWLEAIRRDWPLSIHALGVSLGSAEGLQRDHVARLKRLIDRYEPAMVSEHLAWSVAGGVYLNDLLPLPMTREALGVMTRNVDALQNAIGRPILVENPSVYVGFARNDMSEVDFLRELASKTGCGLLLDVNNVQVSCGNMGLDPYAYLDAFPADLVGEIHLAGHAARDVDGQTVRIDDHGSPVRPDVWRLFRRAIELCGAVPSMIERDNDIPDLSVLVNEIRMARGVVTEVADGAAA